MNILLVEDDAGLVELITTNLEESGFSVISAASGAEALTHLKKQTPDLMLLDYSLPDINGKELIEALNKQQTPPPPFIITTGQGDERIAVDMMKLGAKDYLVKDILFLEKLPDVVKRVVNEIESDVKLKQAEEALKENEVRFRVFMNASNDITFIKDEHFRYLFANEQIAHFFNRTIEELIGKTDEELAEQTQIFPCQSSDKRALGSNEQFTIEEQLGNRIFEVTKLPLQLPNNKKGIGGIMKDITVRVLAEKALKESEERFELAMTATKDGLFDWNLITNEIYYSPGWKNMLGYKDEELANDFSVWEKLTKREDREESRKKHQEIIDKQQDHFEVEFKMKHKDGHWIDILSRADLFFDENGKAIRTVGTHTDISERKREEKILDIELKLFEYAINHSEEEVLQKFLDEAEKLTGSEIGFYHYIEDDQESISLQTWSSNTLNNMCKGEGEATQHYPISKAGVWIDCIKERKPVIHNDYPSLAHKKGLPEGHAPIVRELVVPVIRGNQIMAVFGVGNKKLEYNETDVKSIQRLADVAWETIARKQVEENLKNTFNLSPSIIAKVNLNTGYFVEVNQAVTRVLGYTVEEFTSKPFLEFVHPDTRLKTVDKVSEKLTLNQVTYFENRYLCKDGSSKWMAWNATKVDTHGMVTAIGADISEQKLAQLKLNQSAKLLETSQSIAKLGGWELDIAANHLAWTAETYHIHETSPEEFNPTVDAGVGYFLPESRRIISNALEAAIKEGKGYDLELETLTTKGRRIDIRTTCEVTLLNGKPTKLTGIFQDITEQKQAKEEIKESKEKYKALYDNAPLSYHSLNGDGTILDINPCWLETLGYERSEVIGENYVDFLHPDWKEQFTKNFPALKNRGYVNDVPFKIRHKDGHYIDISLNGQIGSNPDGSFKQTYCVFKDVTANNEAKEKLKISEENLKNTFDISPSIISTVNVETGYFVNISQAVTSILGYSVEEITSKPLMEFIHPDDRQRTADLILELIDGNKTTFFENRYLCKDGSIKWLAWNATKADENSIVTAIATDITEQKLAEEKIRTAEKNLKNTFDLSPSIIAKADMNIGCFIQVNKAITKILGYSIEEFTSVPYMEFVHPDDRQRTIDEATEQMNGNEVIFFENRYLCKDGSYKWLAWHGTKPDENGVVTTIGSDISKRKIIEQEIVETKQFYENIIEGVQDGIWVTDKNDEIFYANLAMEMIISMPRERIQGKNVLKDFPEDTTGEFNKYYKQAKKDKKPVWYVVKMTTAANKIVWENGWLIPQYENENFTGMICTIRDISERKQAEGNVRKLSTAVQQSPSTILIADTEGKVEYVNPKFTELTGYSSAESIGQESNILKSGEQDAAFYNEMWKTIDSGEVWRGQFHNKKKNGELFWEAASISAIYNESGNLINFIKVGEDITQQKNTETELKRALEKALESDRLKSAFLANMSHEIRTPMNGILGFINLLNEPNLTKSQIDSYSKIINKSGYRLLNTINDIIDISKIEAGQMQVSATETSINKVLDEIYSFHSPEANQKGLSLLFNPSLTNEQANIITDSNKLHGILTNLIKNAIKFTEKGTVTFGYLLKENFIEFFVEDTGFGIPKNRIHAIFNRFEQADIEDVKALEGSGLGLAISKAYVTMLGGEISVKSEEDKGSKFVFTIPYVQKPENEIVEFVENIDKGSKKISSMNLLIVEDDEVSKELLKEILIGTFQKISYEQSGIGAIEACRTNLEIDLVLMDLKMPGMDGFRATQQIREFNKDLLIIAQTAYAMPGDREKAVEAGCNDYISKPINKKLLLEIISKHIG